MKCDARHLDKDLSVNEIFALNDQKFSQMAFHSVEDRLYSSTTPEVYIKIKDKIEVSKVYDVMHSNRGIQRKGMSKDFGLVRERLKIDMLSDMTRTVKRTETMTKSDLFFEFKESKTVEVNDTQKQVDDLKVFFDQLHQAGFECHNMLCENKSHLFK